MNLTKINTLWRQIAAARTRCTYNLNTHTQAPGFLSYTAAEEARNEPLKGGNNKRLVVWIEWAFVHSQRIATKEEVKAIREKCEGYTGMTINGDELMVCSEEFYNDVLKNSSFLSIVETHNAEEFDI